MKKSKPCPHSFREMLRKRTHGDALQGHSIGREASYLLDVPTKHHPRGFIRAETKNSLRYNKNIRSCHQW